MTAEHHAILDSIQLEAEVETNRRFLCAAQAGRDELFADEESDEEPKQQAVANDQEAVTTGTEAVYISDDE